MNDEAALKEQSYTDALARSPALVLA